MSEEFEVLKLVCERLEQADLPYMLTGSFAANFYAVPRMTRDIDIVIELHQADIDKVCQVFENDFYLSRDSIVEAIDHERMFNVIHSEFVFKVDFIIRKNAIYRNAEFQRRRRVVFNHASLWIVSPEDLIISKLCWAKESLSEMQLRDVKNLLSSVKDLNEEYIRHWIQVLQLDKVYERMNSYA